MSPDDERDDELLVPARGPNDNRADRAEPAGNLDERDDDHRRHRRGGSDDRRSFPAHWVVAAATLAGTLVGTGGAALVAWSTEHAEDDRLRKAAELGALEAFIAEMPHDLYGLGRLDEPGRRALADRASSSASRVALTASNPLVPPVASALLNDLSWASRLHADLEDTDRALLYVHTYGDSSSPEPFAGQNVDATTARVRLDEVQRIQLEDLRRARESYADDLEVFISLARQSVGVSAQVVQNDIDESLELMGADRRGRWSGHDGSEPLAGQHCS